MAEPLEENGWTSVEDETFAERSAWDRSDGPNSLRIRIVKNSDSYWWVYDKTNSRSLRNSGWFDHKRSSDDFKSWEEAEQYLLRFME